MPNSSQTYSEWSTEELVNRVLALEKQLKESNKRHSARFDSSDTEASPSSPTPSHPAKKQRTFDWSKHSTRFIALKFAYFGRNYNGYEHHANNTTPLPTIEEILWHALMKTKLINPTGDASGKRNAVNWEGCEYSKCGRTDKGVSAFGQVIGIRVRTNRPPRSSIPEYDDRKDELPYLQILNNVLPADIRALAWCASPPEDFSARFSCRARHYKYFFTQPCHTPTPGMKGLQQGFTSVSHSGVKRREGWLDIGLMQDAARRFEGLHDFRNFCKVDPSKQISDHRRRIFHSEIRALTPDEQPAAYVSGPLFREALHNSSTFYETSNLSTHTPQIYVFDLQGSAFLWHQVRHMVAVLFLVGQGLEAPSVIDELLDVSNNPAKPFYVMAEEAPLVLWNCTFPKEGGDPITDGLDWIYAGEIADPSDRKPARKTSAGDISCKYGFRGTVDVTWRLWREAKMDEILRGNLLNLIARQPDVLDRNPGFDTGSPGKKPASQKVFQGGPEPASQGAYTALLNRKRMKRVETQNAEYAEKHGLAGKTAMGGTRTGHPAELRRDHETSQSEVYK